MSLTTLENIKTYLGITTTATDALLTLYQGIVEAEIGQYCNVELIEGTYTETLNYGGSKVDASGYIPFNTRVDYPKLYLKNGVNVTTFTLLSDSTTVSASNYNLNEDNGVVTLYSYYDDSQEKLQASYVAGYTTVTAPIDLQGVVYMGVKTYFENGGTAKQGGGNISSKKIKDFSVAYGNSNTTLIDGSGKGKVYLSANNAILSKYKRIYV